MFTMSFGHNQAVWNFRTDENFYELAIKKGKLSVKIWQVGKHINLIVKTPWVNAKK
jgi:hypothetical protein